MTSAQVVDMTLRVYRQLGWTFLKLTAAPSVFCLASLAFVLDYVLPSLAVTHHQDSINGQITEAGISILTALVVGGPLFLLGLGYISVIVIQLTSSYMVGQPLDEDKAVKEARRLLPFIMALSFWELLQSLSAVIISLIVIGLGALLSTRLANDSPISGLIVMIGFLGIALGGVRFLYIISMHALSPAIAVIEGIGGKAASLRSKWLMKAQYRNVSGVSTLFNCFALMVFVGGIELGGFLLLLNGFDVPSHVKDLVSGSPIGGVLEAACNLFPYFLLVWTLLPVWATCVTIVYYERRIRLEGFDIEVLADEIGKSGKGRFDV
jgi:hypothetical protein